jgi:hypothetical protein
LLIAALAFALRNPTTRAGRRLWREKRHSKIRSATRARLGERTIAALLAYFATQQIGQGFQLNWPELFKGLCGRVEAKVSVAKACTWTAFQLSSRAPAKIAR